MRKPSSAEDPWANRLQINAPGHSCLDLRVTQVRGSGHLVAVSTEGEHRWLTFCRRRSRRLGKPLRSGRRFSERHLGCVPCAGARSDQRAEGDRCPLGRRKLARGRHQARARRRSRSDQGALRDQPLGSGVDLRHGPAGDHRALGPTCLASRPHCTPAGGRWLGRTRYRRPRGLGFRV